jgi:hypothetical protein
VKSNNTCMDFGKGIFRILRKIDKNTADDNTHYFVSEDFAVGFCLRIFSGLSQILYFSLYVSSHTNMAHPQDKRVKVKGENQGI